MNFLEERIIKDGIVREGNVLKVDSFLNHHIDELDLNLDKQYRICFYELPESQYLNFSGNQYQGKLNPVKFLESGKQIWNPVKFLESGKTGLIPDSVPDSTGLGPD